MDESHSPGRSRWGKQSLELVRRAVLSSSLGWERGCFVLSSQPQAGCSLFDTRDANFWLPREAARLTGGDIVALATSAEGLHCEDS